MRKIRCAMFETNSSSCHSISINPGQCDDMLKPDSSGVVTVTTGEFGWEVETYNDAWTKASYCLTYARQIKSVEYEQMLHRVIQRHTNAKEVTFRGSGTPGNYDEWGHIDHHSCEDDPVCEAAFADDVALHRFLFCRQSTLHTDNDNH